jgi:hypothetical protein
MNNLVTTDLKIIRNNTLIKITRVYEPSSGNDREWFLQQIRNEKSIDDEP